MNLALSSTAIKKFVITTLHRYHVVLFVIIVLGGLAVMVFFLNQILVKSSTPDGYTSSSNDASFDQQTIDRIKNLRETTDTSSQIDLSGRSNPFVE
jgi:hypothetical protein